MGVDFGYACRTIYQGDTMDAVMHIGTPVRSYGSGKSAQKKSGCTIKGGKMVCLPKKTGKGK